jgi:hypothetical protein
VSDSTDGDLRPVTPSPRLQAALEELAAAMAEEFEDEVSGFAAQPRLDLGGNLATGLIPSGQRGTAFTACIGFGGSGCDWNCTLFYTDD